MSSFEKIIIEGNFSGPHLLITAGVHGDEYEPMEACRELAGLLLSRRETLRGRVTLIPVVNQPAFRLASRTGPDGKDLARICPGKVDGSVSERIAHELSAIIRTADFYLDMHNGGHRYSIYPFSGYTLHPDLSIAARQKEMAEACGLPLVWGSDPALNGRTLSVARDAQIPAIYTETGGSCTYRPLMKKYSVDACRNLLYYLDMIDEPGDREEVQYHLEDYRSQSGHLQILLPSPMPGFFISRVAAGTIVEKGELLGNIKSESGDKDLPVTADRSGIILVIRNIPSVAEGESLGAILPLTGTQKFQKLYD